MIQGAGGRHGIQALNFFQDMLKAFEDLPPDAFSAFRHEAAELGVPLEVFCLVALKDYLRNRRRGQR